MTEALLAATLEHLGRLVAFDTRNPPRAIDEGGIFGYLGERLRSCGFTCEVRSLGDGCVSLLATRGDPRLLFNVHVDTVPADPGWTGDPLALRVEDDRAIGLGACDIKGAAAALLAAAAVTDGPGALLFSSDEEAGQSRCIRDFLGRRRFEEVLVAEPTRCEAIAEHRGIASATATFSGIGGHASAARALSDSAVHAAVRWASAALATASDSEHVSEDMSDRASEGRLRGLRLNLGRIEGGQKPNMIAAAAMIRFGVRPPPDLPPAQALARLAALAPEPSRATFTPGFLAPPLPARPPESLAAARAAAAAMAGRLGLTMGAPVDFWTEAALFSEAGANVLVYGPGDIAQAHTAGEHVAIAELARAAATYVRLLGGAPL